MAAARTVALVALLVLAGVASPAALGQSSAGAGVRTADAATAQSSTPAPTLEYGDAPDPTYPTDFASDGARHNETSYAVLGDDASTEAGPRATDTHDDGLAWVDDDTVRVDATSNYANREVTVNVLVDRGADGDWNESGDWVVRNATGILDAAGEATFTFDLPVSRCSYSDREPSWLRVTLTQNSVDDYDGTGSFPVGETEDYRINGSGCEGSADVFLRKSASVSTVESGEDVTYALAVENDGPNATTVSVVDDLPACMDYVASRGPGSYDPASNTWTVHLDPGETATMALTVTVDCAAGNVTNDASATANLTDPDPTDNDASTTVEVTNGSAGRSADLVLHKQVSPPDAIQGDQVTYALTVANDGPNAATATVVDDLPSCVVVQSTSGPGTYAGGTWTVDLQPGENATLDLVATVNCPPGTAVVNTANATGNVTDPDPSDNEGSATVTVGVREMADLTLDKRVNVSTVRQGEQVTYTLAVTNIGLSHSGGVAVLENLHSCMNVESTTGPGVYIQGRNVWFLHGVAPGQTATLELVATVTCDVGYVTNTANITGNFTDPGGDSANATVNVLGNRRDHFEFGDAPDPPYNTTLNNAGPYATRMPGGEPGPYAGENVSFEGSANLVNGDEHDDGFVANESTTEELTVMVSNNYSATNQNPIWINVFVDLNGDGDWQDPGEWPVRNASVTVDGTETVSFNVSTNVSRYLAGHTQGGYTRLMVTAGGIPADLRGGRGSPWHWGEIEDYSQEEMGEIARYDGVSVPGFTVVHVLAALGAGALLALRRR